MKGRRGGKGRGKDEEVGKGGKIREVNKGGWIVVVPPEALRVDRQTDGGKSLGGKEGEGGLLFFCFFIIVVG